MLPKLENPWKVESLYEFQYFKCPSCEFKDEKKQDFLYHAYEFHPESVDYLSIITDGSLGDVLCPWDSQEFTDEDHGMVDVKTEDVEDILGINEESTQNYHVDGQMVKCYYCAKEMDRSSVRTHMQKSHESKPVIFNIIKDAKNSPMDDDKTKIIAKIKDEEINPQLESTMEEDVYNDGATVSITMAMCYHCNTALNYSEIRKHIEEQHPGEEVLYFPIDSVKTNDQVENVIHKDQIDFNCDVCGKSFSRADNLKTHINSIHNALKDHKCDTCEKTFSTKTTLKYHVMAIHKQLKPHKCGSCDKAFVKKSSLDEHVKTYHKIQAEEYRCDECGKHYRSKIKLNMHKKSVHGEKKLFQCETCENSFPSSKRLLYHVMSIHEGLRPHKCVSCEKAFVKEKSLNEHIKVFHTDQRDHPCNHCEKKFALKKRLRTHIKDAHGDNVYICEICSSAFNTTSGLKGHIKRFHEDDTYYCMVVCSQCGKSMRNNYLTQHMRIVHEGIRNSKCDVCGKLFSQASKLKKHMLSGKKLYLPKPFYIETFFKMFLILNVETAK